MNTTKTLLPATRVEVPASEYTITNLKTLQTNDGYAYTATLRRGKAIVANLHQQGNGGMTFTYWTSEREQVLFDAYVGQHEGTWGKSMFAPEGYDWDEENALETLVEEIVLQRELNRKARTQVLFLEPDCANPQEAYNALKGTTAANPRINEIMAKYAPRYTHIWKDGSWVAR